MLEGYRIIEMGQVIAGTMGGMILADMGAEVVKVETPRGDLGRNPSIAGLRGISSIFLTFNRGKKSVVLDLKRPEGREVFLDLVAVSDAVMVNFRPGAMDRLGLGFDALREKNPGIVLVESSGYGTKGPWRDLPAFDLVEQAMSGHMSITGEPDRPPVRNGAPTADLTTALYQALACMSGLLGRAKRGDGTHLEVPMFDVQLAMLGYIPTVYLTAGHVPRPPGSAHEYMVPYQAFATKTLYVVLSPREERFWKITCGVLGIPELADDPRFATNALRSKNRAELLPVIEKIMLTRTAEEWIALFAEAGAPCAPVNTLDLALDNEQVETRELIWETEYPGEGKVRMVGNPILDLRTGKRGDSRPAPTLGEHTEAVLAGILGYPAERVQRLLDEGVAAGARPAPAR